MDVGRDVGPEDTMVPGLREWIQDKYLVTGDDRDYLTAAGLKNLYKGHGGVPARDFSQVLLVYFKGVPGATPKERSETMRNFVLGVTLRPNK